MCCLEALRAWSSNHFPRTNRESDQNTATPQQEGNTSTQTIVRFSAFTITVPVPTSSQACTLLHQYKKTSKFQNYPPFLLFYLVLKNLIDNSIDNTQDILHIASHAWRSAEVDFREAYELLLEDENVKN